MEQPSWINRTLNNRYRIEALLGRGGMSAVYKATDPNLKRVIAIKLIHPLDSSLKCNFDGRKEVSCGKISLQDLTSQRSAYGLHAAHPGTKIPDICVVERSRSTLQLRQ